MASGLTVPLAALLGTQVCLLYPAVLLVATLVPDNLHNYTTTWFWSWFLYLPLSVRS